MLKTVVTTLGLALAACSVGSVGGGGDTDGGAGDPRAGTFAQEVLPIVMAQGCTNLSCHGGVQNPQLNSFQLMTSNGLPGRYTTTPATANVIITKDATTPGMHPTAGAGIPYLNQVGKDAISAWLNSGP